MRKFAVSLAGLVSLFLANNAFAAGDPKRGAQVYQACVGCHALEPGLHLSGPSLDGFMGRLAGTAEGFVRYSSGLKDSGFFWDATSLDGWLKQPQEMIPGTYMTFRGIDDPLARADLIAFLEFAGQPGGGEKAIAQKIIPESWLRAGAPKPIGKASPQTRIAAIRHCGDSYFITTEDDQETAYWEKNIRLKIDSFETGPPVGVPVILGSGMGGDRFSVVFASVIDLQQFVSESCESD